MSSLLKKSMFFTSGQLMHVSYHDIKTQWRQGTLVLLWEKLGQVSPRQRNRRWLHLLYLMEKTKLPGRHCGFCHTIAIMGAAYPKVKKHTFFNNEGKCTERHALLQIYIYTDTPGNTQLYIYAHRLLRLHRAITFKCRGLASSVLFVSLLPPSPFCCWMCQHLS